MIWKNESIKEIRYIEICAVTDDGNECVARFEFPERTLFNPLLAVGYSKTDGRNQLYLNFEYEPQKAKLDKLSRTQTD